MKSCKWKITYNNPNHCSMMEMANTPTRPPWRPAASSVTASKENKGPTPHRSGILRSRQRAGELTVPPQYMSVTDLMAAMPRRERVPLPQTLCSGFGLAEDQRQGLKTPYASTYDPLRQHLQTDITLGKPKKSTSKSVLDQVAKSMASSKSHCSAAPNGSGMASPPSAARSLISSATPSIAGSVAPSVARSVAPSIARSVAPSIAGSVAPSVGGSEMGLEWHYSVPSCHSAATSPTFPKKSQELESPRCNIGGATSGLVSLASPARSEVGSPRQAPSIFGSTQLSSPHRTIATTSTRTGTCMTKCTGLGSKLVSTNDMSATESANVRSLKFGTRTNNRRNGTGDSCKNKGYSSRGTIGGGSTPRSPTSSRCTTKNSSPSHRSLRASNPPSGRCSPPTPPASYAPSYSPY